MTKFKLGKYKTTGGYEAEILKIVEGQEYPLIGYVTYPDEKVWANSWRADGQCMDKDLHLILPEPEKVKLSLGWVNIWRKPDGSLDCGSWWPTRQKALEMNHTDGTRFACVEVFVEATEGQGIEGGEA